MVQIHPDPPLSVVLLVLLLMIIGVLVDAGVTQAVPSLYRSPAYGAIAQLGERLPCTQEVSGSIPLSSTIYGRSTDGIRGKANVYSYRVL